MRILAIETSGLSGSVVTWDASQPHQPRQWLLPEGSRSASSLAPTIQLALAETGWQPTHVELVAVTSGPGSFTSLRVGVVTAKAFAYGVGCPVIGVNSLKAIAMQSGMQCAERLFTVIDAQRGEFFLAVWKVDDQGESPVLSELESTTIIAGDELTARLRAEDAITGPPLESLRSRLPAGVTIAESSCWQPQAVSVGQLGHRQYLSTGNSAESDPFALVPKYFRRTAAEEQWERRAGLSNQPNP
jgi:tRNA threonylcarbamoyladenosine biosynthesis protein TsaB